MPPPRALRDGGAIKAFMPPPRAVRDGGAIKAFMPPPRAVRDGGAIKESIPPLGEGWVLTVAVIGGGAKAAASSGSG